MRRVDNYVSRLRQKLKREDGPDLIRSFWGVGYRMEL
ncbi:MAG: helix-turn-helix domain-containing protein [Vulcanimicrobiota bacterium]